MEGESLGQGQAVMGAAEDSQCSGMDTANSGEDRWRLLAMRFKFRCQRRSLISIGRWVLWTECFHPPQIHILKPNPQYGRIWR